MDTLGYRHISQIFIHTLQHECGGIKLGAAELTWVAGAAKMFGVAFDGLGIEDRAAAISALATMREEAIKQFAPGEIVRMFDELIGGLSKPGWVLSG